MHLVPIPTTEQHIEATAQHWAPFLPAIAKRSGERIEDLVSQLLSHEVQPVLIWDGEKARALLGVRFRTIGTDRIGELVWLTGIGREAWQHLLPELEKYLKDVGCARCVPICRPGWSRLLKKQGYRMSHVVMEKSL